MRAAGFRPASWPCGIPMAGWSRSCPATEAKQRGTSKETPAVSSSSTRRQVMGEPNPQAFVGTWKGQWDRTQDFEITIEKVVGNNAHYTFRFEACEHWGVPEAHGKSGVSEISGGSFVIEDVMSFMYVSDSRLDGKLTVGPFTNQGAFTKE